MPEYITKKIALPTQITGSEIVNSNDQIIFADPVILIDQNGEFLASTTDGGSAITGTTIPAGGSGSVGWLSAIWQQVSSLLTIFTRPTISYISGVISTSGDNLVVAPPGANLSIHITHISIQNESSVATTILLKDSNSLVRVLGQNQGDGIALVLPERREIKLLANTGLTLNLSGSNSVGYSIGYWIG